MSNKRNTTGFIYRFFAVVLFFPLLSGFNTSNDKEEIKTSLSKVPLLRDGEPMHSAGTRDKSMKAAFEGDSEPTACLPADSVPFHTVRVALVQYDAVPEQPERNLREMERLIRQAAAMGGRIVVFHEMSLSDYTPRVKDFAERIPDGPACRRMGALARELNCFVSFGMPERAGKRKMNGSISPRYSSDPKDMYTATGKPGSGGTTKRMTNGTGKNLHGMIPVPVRNFF